MTPLLRKRDGSVVEVIHNPDGSWVEIPAQDAQAEVSDNRLLTLPPRVVTTDGDLSAPEHVRQFLREIGRRGGQARAHRHSHQELAAWGPKCASL